MGTQRKSKETHIPGNRDYVWYGEWCPSHARWLARFAIVRQNEPHGVLPLYPPSLFTYAGGLVICSRGKQ